MKSRREREIEIVGDNFRWSRSTWHRNRFGINQNVFWHQIHSKIDLSHNISSFCLEGRKGGGIFLGEGKKFMVAKMNFMEFNPFSSLKPTNKFPHIYFCYMLCIRSKNEIFTSFCISLSSPEEKKNFKIQCKMEMLYAKSFCSSYTLLFHTIKPIWNTVLLLLLLRWENVWILHAIYRAFLIIHSKSRISLQSIYSPHWCYIERERTYLYNDYTKKVPRKNEISIF